MKRIENRLAIRLFFALLFFVSTVEAQYKPDIELKELFKDVQLGRVFNDSKTFADCTPRFAVDSILSSYHLEKLKSGFDLKTFVEANFILPVKPQPSIDKKEFPTIDDHINDLWKQLERPASNSKGSLIGLPYSYIVPGGRFGEVYYWDSYFTILGLKQAGRNDLIKNMIDNFAYLIHQYGFIPNGNRSYYLSRSQPPYFSMMVELLAESEGDTIYTHYLPALLVEYNFWMKGSDRLNSQKNAIDRVVRLSDTEILNRYWDNSATPRPESYKEDVETATGKKNPELVFRNIRAACESGWDFSARWFKDGLTLESIHTTDIIPVDLNCLLYMLEKNIAKAYNLMNNANESGVYNQRAARRKAAILKYCWNEKMGFFLDYDFLERKNTAIESLATVYPLYFKIATTEQAEKVAQKIAQHFLFPGGLITTLKLTTQQWDAPNGWAPLQWMTYKALRNYSFDSSADTIRKRWMHTVETQYKSSGKLLEKYNVLYPEIPGGGGEYPSQDGFGWTNGVYLQMKSEK
ncbi:Periplasmic trehalase precursor [compost metagenome]